ncbi:MAG: ABC transporter ATP-binding protein [Candidatus Bathyarchaeia archaeon]
MTGFPYHPPFPGEEREGYVRKMPDRVLISRLIKYFFPYRKRLAIILTAIITVSVTGLVGPYLLKMAIDTYITQGKLMGLSILSLIYIGITLVNWFSDSVRTYQLGWVGERMLFEMREQMFSRLQELSFSFYDRSEMGEIMSRVTNDTDSIGEAFISGVVNVISDIFSLAGAIAIMFFMSPPLALVSLTVTPLILASGLLFQPRFRSAYRKTRVKIAEVTSRLQEGISGIREIQSFSRERDTMMDFRQANIENLQANLQATKVQGIFQPIIQMIGAVGNFIVLAYGGMLLMEGTLTVGTLIAFLLYIQRFFSPILDLASFYNTVQEAMAAAERIFEVIDTEPQIKDASDAVELPPIKGEVSFENVTFGYDPDYPVLHNINFHVKPKENIALVGPTGAGKSTIIKLLSRFYELQSGTIKIDGYDIRKVTQESLRQQMGTVLQENFLFAGTIMENIRYGRLDATDEEVIKAAERVGAHEFIMRLPNGYNTEIRERGQGLSVGQKQLIAFARALLSDPPILILDEATSSIDPYTELIIKRALAILLKDRTSFVIAHRLSTVRNADRILVIDNGKIVEEGNHRQLMRKGGLYRRLYEMQFKEPEELAVTPMIAAPNPASKNPQR